MTILNFDPIMGIFKFWGSCKRSVLKYETQLKVFWGSQDQYNHNFWRHLENSIFFIFVGILATPKVGGLLSNLNNFFQFYPSYFFKTFSKYIYFSTWGDVFMARYDTTDFLASKTSGSFQVLQNKSEIQFENVKLIHVFFVQVLDNLELSEPLDLAFVLIQVSLFLSVLLSDFGFVSISWQLCVTLDWKVLYVDIFTALLLLHCAYGLRSHLQVIRSVSIEL